MLAINGIEGVYVYIDSANLNIVGTHHKGAFHICI